MMMPDPEDEAVAEELTPRASQTALSHALAARRKPAKGEESVAVKEMLKPTLDNKMQGPRMPGASPFKVATCRFCDREFSARSIKHHQKKCSLLQQQREEAEVLREAEGGPAPAVVYSATPEEDEAIPMSIEARSEARVDHEPRFGFEAAECRAPPRRQAPQQAGQSYAAGEASSVTSPLAIEPAVEDRRRSVQRHSREVQREEATVEETGTPWANAACVAPKQRAV